MEVYKKVVDLDLLITVNQIQCWKYMLKYIMEEITSLGREKGASSKKP
jgi:hypothetical protein